MGARYHPEGSCPERFRVRRRRGGGGGGGRVCRRLLAAAHAAQNAPANGHSCSPHGPNGCPAAGRGAELRRSREVSGGHGGGGDSAHRRSLGRRARGGPRWLDGDHRYRGGRGGQPGQGLRAQERRVPLREHRRRPGGCGAGGDRRCGTERPEPAAPGLHPRPRVPGASEMGNFAIWCKKGPVLKRSPPPVPKPRSISAGLRHLSLQSSDSDQKSPPARCSIKRAAQHEALYDASNIYGLSAMDGVPFTLHPKFESKLSSGSNAILADLNVKSLADIEKEYNYAFVVERTAAARLPPGVC
ncbi:multivesicular body subunit 12A isoform X1 [Rissa tridactyla]|uniref:multivesicular body subunit 12A isoform X1 n=1 Tax=Rissa tridactyla TaxID=75485 RepID=UPI0023BA5E2F|nr:multivesicular body subunit 12A isoform X1 [Rissa tridactyla]